MLILKEFTIPFLCTIYSDIFYSVCTVAHLQLLFKSWKLLLLDDISTKIGKFFRMTRKNKQNFSHYSNEINTFFEIFEKNVTFWHWARVSTMSRNKIRNIIENTVDDDHGDKTTGQPAWARSRSWKLSKIGKHRCVALFHSVCLHLSQSVPSRWLVSVELESATLIGCAWPVPSVRSFVYFVRLSFEPTLL